MKSGFITIKFMKVSPSMLACDFSNMEKEIKKIKNADMVHMDVMDGNFVPNISFGSDIIKSLRSKSLLPFDTHLMIDHPLKYIKSFADAGSDIITFHIESKSDTLSTINEIRKYNKKVGISLKPNTRPDVLIPFLDKIDLVLIMTVEPGFGGQSFMHDQLPKIAELRQEIDKRGLACELEVDGGVDPVTAKLVKDAGATVLVAGSAVFGKPDRKAQIDAIRNA